MLGFPSSVIRAAVPWLRPVETYFIFSAVVSPLFRSVLVFFVLLPQWKAEGRMVDDGVHSKLLNHKGSLAAKNSDQIFEYPAYEKHVACH